MTIDEIGFQLTEWGRVVKIATTGRVSGEPVVVAVGFVLEADGSLLVAAGDPDADWARNLEFDPRCRLTVGERSWDAVAGPLDSVEAGRAVAELILKYGTPAERLGRGPAFRLRPAARGAEQSPGP